MAAAPANPMPAISPAEMQILVSRAGLVLNPGQVADLVLAWRQVAGLIASIPHERKLADDMALRFHLSPPVGTAVAPGETPARSKPVKLAPRRKKPAVASAKKKPAAKTTPKLKLKLKLKPKSKPSPARKTPARKSATRGR